MCRLKGSRGYGDWCIATSLAGVIPEIVLPATPPVVPIVLPLMPVKPLVVVVVVFILRVLKLEDDRCLLEGVG